MAELRVAVWREGQRCESCPPSTTELSPGNPGGLLTSSCMQSTSAEQLAVLFVHGTGTRPKNQRENLARVRNAFARNNVPGELASFYWGHHLGAALGFDGKSIPSFDEAADPDGVENYDDPGSEGYWETLAGDPFHQLRSRETERALRGTIGDKAAPGERAIARIAAYYPSQELLDSEIGGYIVAGIHTVRASSSFEKAAARTQYGDLAEMFARAVVGYCLNELAASFESWPKVGQREDYVRIMVLELGASTLGGRLQWFVSPFVSFKMRKRSEVTRSATPFIGDIMRFVRDPLPFRAALRSCLDDMEATDVVLLGHSLGGVLAIDLLVNGGHPKIRGVVTLGSQSGILREFDVVPVGNADVFQRIPWLNVYHGRDYLSYLAEPIFTGGMVEDYRISDWQPFPSAHSSYLRADQDRMWQKVCELIATATR